MAKIATLTDNFATQDTAKWFFNTEAVVSGGVVTITPTTGYPGIFDLVTGWDLTASEAFLEVQQIPNVGNGTTESFFTLEVSAGNNLRFHPLNGTLYATRTISSSETVVASRAYNATTDRWWKIAESGGTVTWYTSSDGITWNSFGTWVVSGLTLTSVTASFTAGYFGTEPAPGTAVIDNFNIPGVPPPTDLLRVPVQVIQVP